MLIHECSGHPPAWLGIPQNANPLDVNMSGSPQIPETYEYIRSCLRDCEANHPECKVAGQELPTRLLDVQHEGAQQVILVETASLSVGAKMTYIALSYCWGKGQSLTLTSENLEVMKLGLMVSSLPQTLQDAIAVTRTLGQQYLWVDALCIIQNSPSDWEVESSRMASVYRDAYLTIAAATASDVTEGFLSRNYRETNPWYREPCHEEWINQEACSTILGVREINNFLRRQEDHNRALALPWNLRGWTLQEQLLSRRVLKYHAYELRWVCQNKAACQCRSNWSCSLVAKDPLDSPTYRFESAKLAHTQWRHIVVDYTARELTDARDKLPAISGLAQVFQQVIQSPYIAGMWENQLPLSLLWVASGSQVRCAPELYIAPTFCWASTSSPVQGFVEDRFYFTSEWVSQNVVEDTCSIADGKDPLGRVNNGWIKLCGYIFRAALVDYPERGARYSLSTKYLGENPFDNDTWLEESEATDEHGNLERSVRRFRRLSSITPQEHEPSPPRIPSAAVVYLFLVGSISGRVFFLVLGLSSDKPGMYERLGLLQHREYTQGQWDDWISGLISAADEHKVITIV